MAPKRRRNLISAARGPVFFCFRACARRPAAAATLHARGSTPPRQRRRSRARRRGAGKGGGACGCLDRTPRKDFIRRRDGPRGGRRVPAAHRFRHGCVLHGQEGHREQLTQVDGVPARRGGRGRRPQPRRLQGRVWAAPEFQAATAGYGRREEARVRGRSCGAAHKAERVPSARARACPSLLCIQVGLADAQRSAHFYPYARAMWIELLSSPCPPVLSPPRSLMQ